MKGKGKFVRLEPDDEQFLDNASVEMSESLGIRVTLSDIIRIALKDFRKKYEEE